MPSLHHRCRRQLERTLPLPDLWCVLRHLPCLVLLDGSRRSSRGLDRTPDTSPRLHDRDQPAPAALRGAAGRGWGIRILYGVPGPAVPLPGTGARRRALRACTCTERDGPAPPVAAGGSPWPGSLGRARSLRGGGGTAAGISRGCGGADRRGGRSGVGCSRGTGCRADSAARIVPWRVWLRPDGFEMPLRAHDRDRFLSGGGRMLDVPAQDR
jgi:hypothetical protein